jgi:uncharacterized RDD family membrane protein YckC
MHTEPQSTPRVAARNHETTAIDLRQVVLAPEQVELHMPVAGPTSRMLAYAIDLVFVVVIEGGVLALVLISTRWAGTLIDWVTSAMPSELNPGDLERLLRSSYLLYILAAAVLLQFILEFAYFMLWETVWSGRSPGKGLLQLRVVGDDGRPVTPQQSLIRNLLRVVDMLPANYVAGLGAMLLSPQGKRLGDLAAGTVVIRFDRPLAPGALPPVDEAAMVFRFDRVQVARLQSLDRQLILETLRRLEQLPPDRANVLLERTVRAIRQRIGYGEVGVGEYRAFLLALLRAVGEGHARESSSPSLKGRDHQARAFAQVLMPKPRCC